MTDVALKVKIGIAACAVAASASLVPITVAQAAPVQAPATPVLFGPGDVPQTWWHRGSPDLMLSLKPIQKISFIFSFFKSWGCYGHHSI